MDYLILSGFGVVKVAQAKVLRDALHFVGATAGEVPVLKSLVCVSAGVRRAITAQDFRRVVLGIEADGQQMRLCVNIRLLLQLLIDRGKVAAHQRALVGHGTARVDESERQRLAAILREMNSLSILIHETKVGDVSTGPWFAGYVDGL